MSNTVFDVNIDTDHLEYLWEKNLYCLIYLIQKPAKFIFQYKVGFLVYLS